VSVEAGRPLRLLVEVGDGRAAGAILENGFLQHCVDAGAEVHVLTPGARYEPFVERYRLPGVRFSYISVETADRLRHGWVFLFEARLARWLCQHRLYRARRALWRLAGERAAIADAGDWRRVVEEDEPDCFVSLNLTLGFGRGIAAVCRRAGVPSLGNVFSWDHPYFDQRTRPDRLTCWSPMMKEALVARAGFRASQIDAVGAPAFDAYFDPSGIWTRKELCRRLGLDPARPILLYATLGQIRQHWDETGIFRAVLAALDKAELPGPPQVVLRLHPLSVDYYFDEFLSRRDVTVSRYVRSCPGMRWWPSREEMILAGNLLRHADVCISPGSTMAVEPAIFDTPTIVPAFNPAIPEEFDRFFKANWLNQHLRFLADEGRIPVPGNEEELVAALRRALADRESEAEGRKRIRAHVLGPLDGRATERLAGAALRLAGSGMERRNGRRRAAGEKESAVSRGTES
jgi:hypothetical protein